jgi:hypothetical protein
VDKTPASQDDALIDVLSKRRLFRRRGLANLVGPGHRSAISTKPIQKNPPCADTRRQTGGDRVQIKFRSLEHTSPASGNRCGVNHARESND